MRKCVLSHNSIITNNEINSLIRCFFL